jgi:hypothetical protein
MDAVIEDLAKRNYYNNIPGYWNPCPTFNTYVTPPVQPINYTGSQVSSPGSELNSFGMEYTKITFNDAGEVYVTFIANPANSSTHPQYSANVVFDDDQNKTSHAIPLNSDASGELKFTVSNPGTTAVVIVTRIDNKEETIKELYTIFVAPSIPPDALKSDFKKNDKKSGNALAVNDPVDFTDLSHAPGQYQIQNWNWTFNPFCSFAASKC